MPAEHQALAAGYQGSTCPFLDNTGTAMNENDDANHNHQTTEMQMHDDDQHEANEIDVHGGFQDGNIIQITQMHDAQQITQMQMEIRGQPQNPLTAEISQQMPQTAAEARQRMDAIIEAQREAQYAVDQAKEQLLQAQNNLSQSEQHQKSVDEVVTISAEGLTHLLLQEDSNWNTMYQKLVDYRETQGNCDVKKSTTKEQRVGNPDLALLGQWVGRQRVEARRPPGHADKMEPYKIIALDRLAFDWSPRDNAWMQNYEKLKVYLEENPGKMPSRRGDMLGTWCNGQIVEFNKFMAGNPKAYITQKKIDLLNDVGFLWDRTSNTWLQRYQSLQAFHVKRGHCRLPKDDKDQVLYRWITKERIKYRNYLTKQKPRHTDEQWNLLKSIGFMDGDRIPDGTKKRKLEAVQAH